MLLTDGAELLRVGRVAVAGVENDVVHDVVDGISLRDDLKEACVGRDAGD